MKKILKLILVFAVILGAVIGAFFATMNTRYDDILPVILPGVYEMYSDQIENEWEQKGDWDEDLFKMHCDLLNQLSTEYDVTQLREKESFLVVEVVHDKIFAEWASASCRYATIDKYAKALNLICTTYNTAKSNPLVDKIQKVDKVYRSAYNQAYRVIWLTPEFNGTSWNSFDAYSSRVRSDRDKIMNNSIYKEYLSNITDIKNRLNNISSELSSARTSFYNSLATEIAGYYNAIPAESRTWDQLESLRSCRNKYEDEFGSSSEITLCARQFNSDVQNNEIRARLNEM